MTFCAKITMSDGGAKPSVDTCSSACSAKASQGADAASVPHAPTLRDVEAFSCMMQQKGGPLQALDVDIVGDTVEADVEGNVDVGGNVDGDMPSMASLMAQMASVLQGSGLQSSVLQGAVGSVVTETATVSAPHFSAKEIETMLNLLVDRVAISDTKAHMVTMEVSLADTALRGTTLHLTRSLDGLLAVNIMTNDGAIFQTLVAAQVDLRAKLEALDTGMVRVDIAHTNQEQERDPQRRSATYQAYMDNDSEQNKA